MNDNAPPRPSAPLIPIVGVVGDGDQVTFFNTPAAREVRDRGRQLANAARPRLRLVAGDDAEP